MAKRLAAMAVVVLAFMALALPAQAKGEGGVITIKNGGFRPGGVARGGGGTGGGGSAGGGGGASVAPFPTPPTRTAGGGWAFCSGKPGSARPKGDGPLPLGHPLP